MENSNKRARLFLTLQCFRNDPKQSVRALAKVYNVAEATLRRYSKGQLPRGEIIANCRKLDNLEESVLVREILNLDLRGFAPRISDVEDMANRLLKTRDATRVGTRWVQRFIQRHPELKTRLSRPYDY